MTSADEARDPVSGRHVAAGGPEIVFEIRTVEGNSARLLANAQAKAIREVLQWLADKSENDAHRG